MDDFLRRLQAAVGDAYRVERELGGGGMSRLFLAHEVSLDRSVVLKLLPPELADFINAERFRREVVMVARLQHPHIVAVLGTGSADGLTWYTMPYVRGETLRHRVDQVGALPLDEALRIVAETADAMAHAHKHGVVHRDIKPENILLEAGHAVVADFGIAHAASTAAVGLEAHRLTSTGTSIGTIGYMAPEQITAESSADARSDVYSLAVVAYEALTGRLPFAGRTGAQVLAAQVRDKPPAPSSLRAEIPGAVSDVIMRGLAQSADKRPQTAEEFAVPFLARTRAAAPRKRRMIVTVAAAAAAAAAMVTTLVLRSSFATTSELDENTIVVAPFQVLAPDLALWGEGLVDVLSRSLDGMGPIRTVSPSIAVRAWSGRADPESADALAQETGARLVLFGTLAPSGPDTVRATATLYDAAAGKTVYEFPIREDAQRMDRLADSLTVRAVRFLASDRSLAFTPRASTLGSQSITAIKEYLQAEQLQRGAEFDSAIVHYRRAVQLDPTFALAHWGLANAQSWTPNRTQEDLAHFLTAGSLNVGLGPRDSLLVLADSIAISNARIAADPNGPPIGALLGRAREVLETLTTRYPDAASGWFRLGELLFHQGLTMREPPAFSEVANAFERSIEADSGNSEAYIHAIQLANLRGRREDARRFASAFARIARGTEFGEAAAWVEWFLTQERSDEELKQFVDSVSTRGPIGGVALLLASRQTDSTAAPARFLRIAAESERPIPGLPARGLSNLAQSAARSFAFHGQLERAGAVAASLPVVDVAALARLGVVDADSVARLLADSAAVLASPDSAQTIDLLAFWAWRGDTTAVLSLRDHLAARPAAPNARARRIQEFEKGITEVNLAVARGDSAEALRRIDALPEGAPGLSWVIWRGRLAPLLASRGRVEDALRYAQSGWPPNFGTNTAETAEFILNAARIAERAGEREIAREYYGILATAWAHADPAFAPRVAEVEGALDRLAPPKP